MATAEYIDWSDRGLELHEDGQGSSKFGELGLSEDDATGQIYLFLRRDTVKKRDFTIILPDAIEKELWEILSKKYGNS